MKLKGARTQAERRNTILVPYSIACSVWKVPFLPVIPWQMTRVFLSTKTAGCGGDEDPKCRILVAGDGNGIAGEMEVLGEQIFDEKFANNLLACLAIVVELREGFFSL